MKVPDGTQLGNTPNLYLKIFTCPNDTDKLNRGGGLSYGANVGHYSAEIFGSPGSGAEMQDTGDPFDLTLLGVGAIPAGSVDWWDTGLGVPGAVNDVNNRAQGRATGAFVHRLDTPQTLDGISSADGLSNTVFFAENLQSDNWASPNIAFTSIGAPVDNTNYGDPPATNLYEVRGAGGWGLRFLGAWNLGAGRINQLDTAAIGTAPRPSSNHTGGLVIVGYGDGSARPIADNLDDRVWGRQLTSRGTSDYNQLLEGSN